VLTVNGLAPVGLTPGAIAVVFGLFNPCAHSGGTVFKLDFCTNLGLVPAAAVLGLPPALY